MSRASDRPADVRSAVRGNVFWQALAAAIMLYLGFMLYSDVPEDSVAPQRQGWWIFFYVLRIGGLAMALGAFLSLTGRPFALLFDALAGVLIGAALVVSGLLILQVNTTQALFNVLFGVVFCHAGLHSWRGCQMRNAECGMRNVERDRNAETPKRQNVETSGPEGPHSAPSTPHAARSTPHSEAGYLASFARKPPEQD